METHVKTKSILITRRKAFALGAGYAALLLSSFAVAQETKPTVESIELTLINNSNAAHLDNIVIFQKITPQILVRYRLH